MNIQQTTQQQQQQTTQQQQPTQAQQQLTQHLPPFYEQDYFVLRRFLQAPALYSTEQAQQRLEHIDPNRTLRHTLATYVAMAGWITNDLVIWIQSQQATKFELTSNDRT